MSDLPARPASASRTHLTQLVFPEHANALGKAFGGQVMAWADMAGGVCSMRHSGGPTVTAAVDDLEFTAPVEIGDIAIIEARVNAAFTSSMEIEVTVEVERPGSPERRRCVEALLTFVAIDALGRPRAIPPLLPESADDHVRMEGAARRRALRLARRRSAAP